MSEIRVVDPKTGGEKGSKPERFDLIPPDALEALARVYGMGSGKYSDRNWEKGYRYGLSFAAMMRHAWAWWRGEDNDRESGESHMAHVMFHAIALYTFRLRRSGTDDRSVHPSAANRACDENCGCQQITLRGGGMSVSMRNATEGL